MKKLIATICLFVVSSFSGSARAILIDQGNGLVYDNVLNITWVQDANLCVALGNCANPLHPLPGVTNWFDAKSWADRLVFAGFDDWHLPSVDVNRDGRVVVCRLVSEVECRDNQLGYMYYYNLTPLGDTPPTDLATDLSGDKAPFVKINFGYWSSTEIDPNLTWTFWFSINSGGQFGSLKEIGGFYSWAIRDGDVTAVREPSTLALLAVGVVALGFSRRRFQ